MTEIRERTEGDGGGRRVGMTEMGDTRKGGGRRARNARRGKRGEERVRERAVSASET